MAAALYKAQESAVTQRIIVRIVINEAHFYTRLEVSALFEKILFSPLSCENGTRHVPSHSKCSYS